MKQSEISTRIPKCFW